MLDFSLKYPILTEKGQNTLKNCQNLYKAILKPLFLRKSFQFSESHPLFLYSHFCEKCLSKKPSGSHVLAYRTKLEQMTRKRRRTTTRTTFRLIDRGARGENVRSAETGYFSQRASRSMNLKVVALVLVVVLLVMYSKSSNWFIQ